MKTNVGSYDAGARIVIACGILFMSVNGWGWWALLGLVPLLTAASGVCPLYWLLGINTAKWEEDYESRHPPHSLSKH